MYLHANNLQFDPSLQRGGMAVMGSELMACGIEAWGTGTDVGVGGDGVWAWGGVVGCGGVRAGHWGRGVRTWNGDVGGWGSDVRTDGDDVLAWGRVTGAGGGSVWLGGGSVKMRGVDGAGKGSAALGCGNGVGMGVARTGRRGGRGFVCRSEGMVKAAGVDDDGGRAWQGNRWCGRRTAGVYWLAGGAVKGCVFIGRGRGVPRPTYSPRWGGAAWPRGDYKHGVPPGRAGSPGTRTGRSFRT